MPDKYTTTGNVGGPHATDDPARRTEKSELSVHSRGELQVIAIDRGHPEWVGLGKEDLIKRLESA